MDINPETVVLKPYNFWLCIQGYSLSDVQKCAQKGFNIGVNLGKVTVGLGVDSAGCKAVLKEIGGKHETLLPFHFFIIVKGKFCELACLKYFPIPSQPL